MCFDLSKYTIFDLLFYLFCVDLMFKMGGFEVIFVVYKYFFLRFKRIKESFVFLGFIMIYYKKIYEVYRILVVICVVKCKALLKVKGFIIDGEEVFFRVFEDELKNIRSLRCFKYFEINCKEKLRVIGIWEVKECFFM